MPSETSFSDGTAVRYDDRILWVSELSENSLAAIILLPKDKHGHADHDIILGDNKHSLTFCAKKPPAKLIYGKIKCLIRKSRYPSNEKFEAEIQKKQTEYETKQHGRFVTDNDIYWVVIEGTFISEKPVHTIHFLNVPFCRSTGDVLV